METDHGLALESARLANRLGRFDACLRILGSLGNRRRDPEVALVQLVALVGSGQQSRARQVLESLDAVHFDLSSQVELDLVTAQLANDSGDYESAQRAVAAARARITSGRASAVSAELRLRIELAAAELLARDGQHALSIPGLEQQVRRDPPCNGGEQALRASCLLAEAMAVSGRNEDGLQLAQTLVERIKREGHPATCWNQPPWACPSSASLPGSGIAAILFPLSVSLLRLRRGEPSPVQLQAWRKASWRCIAAARLRL